jgi:hypothetical protein
MLAALTTAYPSKIVKINSADPRPLQEALVEIPEFICTIRQSFTAAQAWASTGDARSVRLAKSALVTYI